MFILNLTAATHFKKVATRATKESCRMLQKHSFMQNCKNNITWAVMFCKTVIFYFVVYLFIY